VGIRQYLCASTQSWEFWSSHENHEHAQYKQYSITTEPHIGGGTGLHADLNGANATAEAIYSLYPAAALAQMGLS
jgi:hypothetical protein